MTNIKYKNDNDKVFKIEPIVQYIKENKISKTEFCRRCKIPYSTLQKILSNNINFNTIALVRIARQLNIEICELFIK